MVDLKITLPDGFLAQEERSGYTVTAEMKKVWAVELDLLAEFQRVCEKYNLRYYAVFGTLLGTIRHGGFIPWDDDVDVAMTRDQYELLLQHVDEFREPYFLQTEYSCPGSYRGYAQLRNSATAGMVVYERDMPINKGIFLDIFVLDAVPDDEDERAGFIREIQDAAGKMYRASRFGSHYYSASTWLKRAVKRVVHFALNKPIAKYERQCFREYEQTCAKYRDKNTQSIAYVSFYRSDKFVHEKRLCEDVVWKQFEFLRVPVPAGYDAWLRDKYGDYMMPVRGTAEHTFEILSADRSYRELCPDPTKPKKKK